MKNRACFVLGVWLLVLGVAGCADDASDAVPDGGSQEQAEDSIAAHCSAVGTWDHHLSEGRRWGLSAVDLSANGEDATVTSIDGCSFVMTVGSQSVSVSCTASGVTLPIEVGKTYTLDACATQWSFGGGEHSFIVLRDLAGNLVLAGGTGVELVEDVACLPEELMVSKIDEACPPLEGVDDCGPRRNFGIRIAHDSQVVDLWSGDAEPMTIGESSYTAINFYSFETVDWESNCTDQANQYMSWALVRGAP